MDIAIQWYKKAALGGNDRAIGWLEELGIKN